MNDGGLADGEAGDEENPRPGDGTSDSPGFVCTGCSFSRGLPNYKRQRGGRKRVDEEAD